jgi:hypothetical protein
MDPAEIDCDDERWKVLAQYRVQRRVLVLEVSNLCVSV